MDGDGLKEILILGHIYKFTRFGPEGHVFEKAGKLDWPVQDN